MHLARILIYSHSYTLSPSLFWIKTADEVLISTRILNETNYIRVNGGACVYIRLSALSLFLSVCMCE